MQSMSIQRAVYFLTVSLVVALLAASSLAVAADPPAAAPREPQAIFDKLCASCHGANGRGVATKAVTLKIDAVKLDLYREDVHDMKREEMKKILLEGHEKMPAYAKKVKDPEVEPLLDLVMKLRADAAGKP